MGYGWFAVERVNDLKYLSVASVSGSNEEATIVDLGQIEDRVTVWVGEVEA